MTSFILLGSYTMAVKAANILRNNGISARVERTASSGGGCAFGIRVGADAAYASEMLRKKGISVQKAVK